MNIAHPSDRIVAGFFDVITASVIQSVCFLLFRYPGIWLGGLAAVAYLIFRDSLPFMNYQSVGKKVLRLRVVKKNGNLPLTPKEAFQRNFIFLPNLLNVLVFSIAYAMGIITLILLVVELYKLYNSEDRQRLGDELAGTIVVKESV